MFDIQERLKEHYEESLEYFSPSQIVGIFVQGSQNYGLDTESSDLDTKLIVAPTLRDLAMNNKPVSTTHVRQNEEHVDWKDVRLYIQTFRKQNLNFTEILFTPYFIVNPLYKDLWEELVANREAITHMNPRRAIQAMVGVAETKYAGMSKPSPAKQANFDKYGYDPKELSHLVRVRMFLDAYLKGIEYERCLRPLESERKVILAIKRGELNLKSAEQAAAANIKMCRGFLKDLDKYPDEEDEHMRFILEKVQYEIIERALKEELK